METLRPSQITDIPRLRELWTLSFGDGGDYLDHFFDSYYAPTRVLVLEVDGAIQAMTTWFSSELRLAGGEGYRCGYLYAVATHPDCRGQGLAGRLLDYCDSALREMGFDAATTVPARPDLHPFFAQNGFSECFHHGERKILSTELGDSVEGMLEAVTPAEYCALRERFLGKTDHIVLDLDGVRYQHGVSKLSGGGMYRWGERALLCTEYGDEQHCYVKEFLGDFDAMHLLPAKNPAKCYLFRTPEGAGEFGMLKWLREDITYDATAYLGFAFD